ncbi:unnamed protein product [Anisakis simplex]|uniref:Ig-like domain-containing protein n=1 Tax=Anisakis simplex TaxID=6269 RepID=A0A0M3K4Y1_ANISI|nr:unnamed protein product [Anisakis simplex]
MRLDRGKRTFAANLEMDQFEERHPYIVNTAKMDGKQINNSDILLLNDRQQLHIESATEEDAGRYSCVAENKPGRVEKDLIVAVLKPPLMEDYQRSFEVPENDTHTLICPINDPSVGIQWSKNGVPITTSNNLQLSTSGHKLHIMRGQVTDGGRYTCRAWNEAGEATSSMDVIILGVWIYAGDAKLLYAVPTSAFAVVT